MENNCLKNMSLEDAIKLQHKLIELICKYLNNNQTLTLGEVGYNNDKNITKRIERIIADFFDAEGAVIVRGSGTGAVEEALKIICRSNRHLIIHKSPTYITTAYTIEDLGLKTKILDFNKINLEGEMVGNNYLIQHSRQSINDKYNLEGIIHVIKKKKGVIIVDDNYTAFKTEKIGCQYGADLSCFSIFKLNGPIGLGCIVGKKKYIDGIKKKQASGGTVIQDFESLEVLRSMVNAPVKFAHQTIEVNKLYKLLKKYKIKCVKSVYKCNMQSYVILVILNQPIADLVIQKSVVLGATNRPVGASSMYDIVPLFYTPSRTFLNEYPDLDNYCIRINPFQSGANNIYRILKESIYYVLKEFNE